MATVLDAGYNIDYIDAASIDKLGAVPYPVLLLPATNRIPLGTYKKIANYAANGGKLIATGRLPTLAPGLKQQSDSAEIASLSDKLFENSNHAGVLVGSLGDLADALHRALPPDVNATGQVDGLGFIHRKLTGSDVYFVVNTSNRPIDGSIHFRSMRVAAEVWNPENGEILDKIHLRDKALIPLVLSPYESRVFVLQDKFDDKSEGPVEKAQSSRTEDHQLAELNSGWQIQFPGSVSSEALSKLTSWSELPGKQYYSGEAIYTRAVTIDQALAPNAQFFLDFGTGTPTTDTRPPNAPGTQAFLDPPIREAAIIFVNGKKAGSLWHAPYRIDISKFVHRGENQIEIHVYNTAINELAGQPVRDDSALIAKYGKRFSAQDMDHLQPLSSGLLGPITLVERNK
jgi:hypothetical protein